MDYYNKIRELTKNVPATLVDFALPRDAVRTPTQASSNFITNKEQGDWAEHLIIRAINETSKNFVAVKYGKSDDLVAGEEGFDTFYKEFQNELDNIGKRPDLLLFKKPDFEEELGLDISQLPHSRLAEYVKKAVAGIEVRSSNYLFDHYRQATQSKIERITQHALEVKDKILSEYIEVLEHPKKKNYIPILESISSESLSKIGFRVPSWRSSTREKELCSHFRALKNKIEELSKRTKLSITVKNEDLQVVYKWIEIFNVPHFYFQVFFDEVIGISFQNVLEILSDSSNKNILYSNEKNEKNQAKRTIHIHYTPSMYLASIVPEPNHYSVRRELNMGKLLFHVTFEGGAAHFEVDNLRHILGINEVDF